MACNTFACGNDLRIVREFVERGVSGENELANRPVLTALLEALTAGGVRHIFNERLDRLARNLLTQESVLAEVRKRGFELMAPSPGNWSTCSATFTDTAANADETIAIQLNSTGQQGNFDDVRLTESPAPPVSVPSTFMMLGAGLLPVIGVIRRRYLNR